MPFSKISKTKTWLQEHPKTKNSKNLKKSCKEASNKKDQKTNYNQNWKMLRMPFSEISKTKKLPLKHTKIKNSNTLKSYVRMPQIKKGKKYKL